ncbi:MAG: T9SS type A sorting domain-containing protein [Bacteroidetes bacterium]|nr:T9SS type A sorting domain-containing protein [Bacteroidota bacterium]MBK6819078.1 T9SS type A sorting domain-containing protein [Bacteroidota bacterium]MBK7587516.1 T9SS type A sorting domain-containing protein [Bacteroidota bacterium]MBK8329729.1 T9SS type A sorting domain-containing protein [Bacteroidota bacterium]MBK9301722.1 T9SS type A sorting domain-containing protein [Bacteroidota bacterium]
MQTGSIFIVGADSINFAVTQGSAVLKKFDKDFNLIWERKYGGSGGENFNLIKYIGDNRLLVRGMSTSLDGDVLNNNNFAINEWVCIMDTNGNILHQLIYSGANDPTQAKNIRIGPNGDIYFCGLADGSAYDFVGNGPFDFASDGYIACTDSLLNKKWLKFFEVSNAGDCSVEDVSFLPNGHLLLVCFSTTSDGAFAVNTPTAKGATILMEMDTLFNIYWQKRYGTATAVNVDGLMSIVYKDPNKWEYYLLGFTSGKDGDCWDSYPYLAKGDHSYHWVMKVDTLGNKVWSHIYGGFSDDGTDHLESFADAFYGNTIHFADGAEGSDNYDLGTAIGKVDTWLIDIDSNGVLYKHQRIGYPNVRWVPRLVRINPLTNEQYYLYFDSKGPNYTPSPNVCDTSLLVENYMIGKYNHWANATTHVTSTVMQLIIYPNPAKEEINIEKLQPGTIIEIYTIEGKKVKSFKTSKTKESISVSGWPRGTYLVKATFKNEVFSQKILLQ